METLTPEQVHVIVQELRGADYNKVGESFFHERVQRLEAAGWVLGIYAYSHKVYRGRRGHLLRHPKYEWRNVAYFFNAATSWRVFYWDNDGYSKQHAQDLALRQPAPKGTFTTYSHPTTGV